MIYYLKLTLFSLSVFIGGCATSPNSVAFRGCNYITPTTLKIKGTISAETAKCIKQGSPAIVDTLLVDTEGGNVRAAIIIANLLESHPHVIVEGQCNSSCANYIIPVARELTLEKSAALSIHGSINKVFVERNREAAALEDRAIFDALEKTAEIQLDFARKNNIHPGWLMVEGPGTFGTSVLSPYLTGDVEELTLFESPARLEKILVDELLLQSCFPNLKINTFVDTYVQKLRISKRLKKHAVENYVFPSGKLVCKPMDVNDYYRNQKL